MYPNILYHPIVCIIFIHSFNASRLQGLTYSNLVLSLGYSFLIYDSSSCGLSDGNAITFGYRSISNHQLDIRKFMMFKSLQPIQTKKEFARSSFGEGMHLISISIITRSMGATTALNYMLKFKNPTVSGLILDSPFKSVKKLFTCMIQQKLKLPKFMAKGIVNMAQKWMLEKIEKSCECPIYQMNLPQEIAISLPMIMLSHPKDEVVAYKHQKQIFGNYLGNKEMFQLIENHQEDRTMYTLKKIESWLRKELSDLRAGEKMEQKEEKVKYTTPRKTGSLTQYLQKGTSVDQRMSKGNASGNSATKLKNRMLRSFDRNEKQL